MNDEQCGGERPEKGDIKGSEERDPGGNDGTDTETRNDTGSDLGRIASNGLEQDGRRDSKGNENPTVGRHVSMTHMEMTSGPLPSAAEFSRYEQVLPGAADRILSMAEQSLQAEIDGQREIRKIYAEDRKAENWCMKFTSAVLSLLIVAIFVTAVVFWSLGKDTEALISIACLVGCLLPRIIDAIKGRKTGENINPPDAGVSSDNDH